MSLLDDREGCGQIAQFVSNDILPFLLSRATTSDMQAFTQALEVRIFLGVVEREN